jgi:hypothetical protein
MVTTPRRAPKSMDDLQEIARMATRSALVGYPGLRALWSELLLGVQFEGDDRIFELYLPGERPEDAQVVSQARVNALSGEVSVAVFPGAVGPRPDPSTRKDDEDLDVSG